MRLDRAASLVRELKEREYASPSFYQYPPPLHLSLSLLPLVTELVDMF